MTYSIIILVLALGFIISKVLIKRAEKKLRKSQEELLITLKDYYLILRIYRDFLKIKKQNAEEFKKLYT